MRSWRYDVGRYGVAAALVGAATVVRFILDPYLVDTVPFITYFAAIAASVWYGRFWSGVLATILSAPAALWFFIPLRHSFSVQESDPVGWGTVGTFVLMGLTVAAAGEAMHRSRARVEIESGSLAAQHEWLRVIVTSIGDAVIATDEAGRISFMNPVAEELTGWTGDEAVSRPFMDVFRAVNEHTGVPVEDACEKVLRTGHIVGLANHTILIAKDGTRRPIDDSAAPILDANRKALGVVVVFRDATEERRAFESVERLAAIVEHSDDAILGKRLDGTITSWNAAGERLYGFREEEAVGRHISIIVPDDRLAELDSIMDRLRAGKRTERLETVRKRKDGSLVDVSVTVSPIKNRYGEIVGASAIGHDVTQQKRAHEALTRREEELNDFFENAAVGLHWVDSDGTILRVNKAELELLGYDAEEYVGRNIAEFHVDRDVIEDILARLKRGETIQSRDARLRCKDGTIKHVLIDSNAYRENGQFIHSRCFTRDVTTEKQAQDALRSSEVRLRLALKAGRVGVWDWELPTDRVTWTENVYEIHGIEPGDFQGNVDAFRRLVHPEDVSRVSESIERTLAGEAEYETEFRIVRPSGEVRWVVNTGQVRRDETGQPVRMLGATFDITERKIAEDNLRFLKEASEVVALQEDVDSAMRQLAKLAVPFFADWAVANLVNESGEIERIAQIHSDSEKARLVEEYSRRYPPDWNVPSPEVRALESGRPQVSPGGVIAAAVDSRHRDLLERLSLRSHLVVPLMRRGHAIGTMSFMRSHAREPFSDDDVDLARELARRAATVIENRRLYDELKASDRQKDEFLAMLAHELRNPLAAIDYAVRLFDVSPEHTQEMVEVIKRQVGQLARLIDDLLDVSRITRNKIQLHREPIDATILVNRAIATVRPLIEKSEHQLVTDLSEREMPLFVDPTRAEQIVVNLLTNAAKYTPRGGTITVEAFPRSDEVVLCVKDSGIGLKDEMLPRIFELFTQVDSTVARTHGGLGIGLPVARRLVEMHGGSIAATSQGPNRGSEFTVLFPLNRGGAGPQASTQGVPSIPQGLKVLIVDDNTDTAASSALLLESLGCVTLQVHDGASAIDSASSFKPDAILLDIGLPGLDGYEVARRIRRDWPKVKLLAVTGYGQPRDQERAREAGFDGHFTKPLKLERLLEFLAKDRTEAGA